MSVRALVFILLAWVSWAHADENRVLSLYDSFGSESGGTVQAWGFSALIQHRGQLILFDGGSSSTILKQNAESLGVDLREVDVAILSHSHYDHISGFDYLLKINPNVKLFLPNDRTIGGRPARDASESEWNRTHRVGYRFPDANAEFVKEHLEIAPGVRLIATTSSLMGLFSKYPPHNEQPLFVGLPELSLALRTAEGRWALLVGCSHSGVDTIVSEAKTELKGDIAALIGGFHLFPYADEQISKVVTRLREQLRVDSVAPAHCTGDLAHEMLKASFGQSYTKFGLGAQVTF